MLLLSFALRITEYYLYILNISCEVLSCYAMIYAMEYRTVTNNVRNPERMDTYMASASNKNAWALFLMILSGIVIGGFLGKLAKGVSALSWLAYGMDFGFKDPVVLDLGVMVLTFGLSVTINIASIIGIVIAIIIYKKL